MKIGNVVRSKLKKQGDTELVTDDSDTDGVAYQNLVSDGLLGTYVTKHTFQGEISVKNPQNPKSEQGL